MISFPPHGQPRERPCSYRVVLLSFLLTLMGGQTSLATSPLRSDMSSRKVFIINRSDAFAKIFWVPPQEYQTSSGSIEMGTISPGQTVPFDTFVGHNFELLEIPHSESESCGGGHETCAVGHFTVKHFAEQGTSGHGNRRNSSGTMALSFHFARYSLDHHGHLRKLHVRRPEFSNFEANCQHNVEPSRCNPQGWNLLNRDASKVHMIQDFISDDECEAMENAARPILHRAAVANGKGGSELTSSRKAMQAGVAVPWHEEANGNPIARLSRRVYDYTNHILGLDIKEDGQEDLMSIQYFGRGDHDPEPDHYIPHCDGECSGLKHKIGTRMATMVMYCTVPKRGGATNFKNAALHVKPKKGNAVFFSYIGSDMIMDNGFTEHSGCPVIEGNKKIVVQWVRHGVDSENPWNSFNTLGVKMTEAL